VEICGLGLGRETSLRGTNYHVASPKSTIAPSSDMGYGMSRLNGAFGKKHVGRCRSEIEQMHINW
jgi:hypothetical protein